MWHFLGRGRNGAKWPTNYHLTFSLSESNQGAAKVILGHGGNVAVVFDSEMPKEYLGHPVIDGNVHDARFLDASGVIVGLSAKGRATMDQSGFVKRPTVS